MNNNEVLKNIRDILKADDNAIAEILALSDVKVSAAEVSSWLKSSGEAGYAEFNDQTLATFLNALIYFKRGKEGDDSVRPLDLPINNNIVLKKIRIAFKLEEKDLVSLSKKSNSTISPKEWNYYFRSQGHKNYKECPDAFLLSVLQGLKQDAS